MLLFTLGGGFFFSLYHMCLTAACERIDVSLAYPLTTTGPLYIPLWAFLFLGERLSALGLSIACQKKYLQKYHRFYICI